MKIYDENGNRVHVYVAYYMVNDDNDSPVEYTSKIFLGYNHFHVQEIALHNPPVGYHLLHVHFVNSENETGTEV